MLKVCYGPFHPDLEDAFASRLEELARRRARVLVVAPSRLLADRLQRLAAIEKGLALADVHFHTFASLALAVTEGVRGGGRLIADPIFHDRIVDGLLERRPALGRIFGGSARPKAMAGAVRASLRDLIDAGVSGAALDEFFGEELPLPPEQRARLRALLALADAYRERLEELRVLSPADIARLAARAAETSRFLEPFQEVLYYGFYDLTGLQLEFFEAVAGRCPTMLFFPFRKGHPAFRFAAPFFEQKLQGRGAEAAAASRAGRPALDAALGRLFDPEGGAAVPGDARGLDVISASGARDEVWAAAKEVLRLVEEEGFSYDEIGVAARTLEPYRTALPEVFRENAIPFCLEEGEPLLRQPLAKGALNLLTLKVRDFPASTVEDLLDSPYLRVREERPARWRAALRALAVHSGREQWLGKLGAAARAGGAFAAEAAWLRDWIMELDGALPGEEPASWSSRVAQALALVRRCLVLPEPADGRERAARELFEAETASLAGFDLLGEPCSGRTFLDALGDKLRAAALESGGAGRGVRVRGVMDGRGESFRALVLLGLKEGQFPRAVREDPLLPDETRAALRHPAGYWLARKAAGHEEERLLFYLASASARERLVCVVPRSDEEGRVEVPSLYLRELCRAAGLDFSGPAVRHVPRQPAAKLESLPPALACPRELTLRLALEGRSAAGRLPPSLADAAAHDEALEAAAAIGSWGSPGAWDGLVGPSAALDALVEGRGLSPSALDVLAACPFQFFAGRVLGLGEPEPPARMSEFPAAARGRLYHEILERFYKTSSGAADWPRELESCLEAVFAERDWRALGLYPVLWQSVKESVAKVLRAFVAWDVDEMGRSGLRPVLLEQGLEGSVALPRPEELDGLRLRGFADRVDRAADGRWRVVDYKTRWSRGANLRRLALSGRLHQLPVYAELGASLPGNGRLEEACIYALEESPETTGRERVCRYPAAELAEDRGAFLRLLAAEVGRVRAGRFPISPEDGEFGACGRCAFAMICRKSHGPSRARAAAALAGEAG